MWYGGWGKGRVDWMGGTDMTGGGGCVGGQVGQEGGRVGYGGQGEG